MNMATETITRDLLEPWSVRKLALRTGGARRALAGCPGRRSAALTVPEIEILAPVIRMSPAELFAELLAVPGDDDNARDRPRGGAGQRAFFVLPEVSLTGLEPMTSTVDAPHSEHLAAVTPIRRAVA